MMSDIPDKKEEQTGFLKRKNEEMCPKEKCMKKEGVDSELKRRDDTSVCLGENEWNPITETPDDRTLVDKLIKHLREIQDMEVCTSFPERSDIVDKMEDILFLIFDIGKDCVTIDDKKKQEIGNLLVKAVQPIRLLSEKAAKWSRGKNPFILKYRSALQYLIDYYAYFPAEGISLNDKLLEGNAIKDSISILDKNIRLYGNRINVEWGFWPFELFGGCRPVPDSHNWWPKDRSSNMKTFVNDKGNTFYCGICKNSY